MSHERPFLGKLREQDVAESEASDTSLDHLGHNLLRYRPPLLDLMTTDSPFSPDRTCLSDPSERLNNENK